MRPGPREAVGVWPVKELVCEAEQERPRSLFTLAALWEGVVTGVAPLSKTVPAKASGYRS